MAKFRYFLYKKSMCVIRTYSFYLLFTVLDTYLSIPSAAYFFAVFLFSDVIECSFLIDSTLTVHFHPAFFMNSKVYMGFEIYPFLVEFLKLINWTIFIKFFNIWISNKFFVLRTLIFSVDIRSFKMNST